MQRLIRSFNTLTDPLKEALQEQYPDGINASDIKDIPTAKGDILRVIELSTTDALYLIKINSESRAEIDEFLEQDDNADDDDMDERDSDMDSDGPDDADDNTDDDDDSDDDNVDEDDDDED